MLEKAENLTLALLLTTAATHEAVESQLASMEGGQHTVNLIWDSRREAQQRKGKEPSKGSKEACYRCGNVGHFGRDPNCPARGKASKKCGGANHFAQQCKTKSLKPARSRPSGKLRLLQTFAGVLREKIRTCAVFKKTHTNYISNVEFEKNNVLFGYSFHKATEAGKRQND